MECPECHRQNPDDSKFCNECGYHFAGPSNIRKSIQLIESERKHVTIMFSDLSGYSAITERLDPEEVKGIMSDLFGKITAIIKSYDGFIERFIGDAVMAVFGVPKSHEDDSIRAIKAARDIHSLVEGYCPNIIDKIGQPLTMHTGINTGLVVTGEVDIEKGTHGITGDPVNLASRLEGIANKGEILVGEQTFHLAEGYFIFEQLKPVKVKGKMAIINAYRVIAPSARRTRFDISSERGLTPLIGRIKELNLLIEGFNHSKEGRGRAFSIISEAGLGKSRLLFEFRKAVAKEQVTFLEGKCLSFSKNTAFHPIIDILKSNFNISDSDNDSEIREKVKAGLKTLAVDEKITLPYLLELLSVSDSGLKNLRLSSDTIQDKIFEALKLISIKGSEIRPLVMAIEDLHWIDKSSEDVFKALIEFITGARILIIFTFRNEYTPPWKDKKYLNIISLNRFDRTECSEMVTQILDSDNIEPALLELIINKTEGVPYFVEELLRSFIALNIIEKKGNRYHLNRKKSVIIPSTIQDIIAARVDSLPVKTKDILQIGSAIERKFSFDLLNYLVDMSKESLVSQLTALKDYELISEGGIYPNNYFIFNHALTQEVVYEGILKQKRLELHNNIGTAIENLYIDKLGDFYGILTEHFIKAKNYTKGAEYSRLARKKCQITGSVKDAIEYTKKTIKCLENLPETKKKQKELIDARTVLGLYLVQMGYHTEANEAVKSIVDVAEKQKYSLRLSQIYTIIGTYNYLVQENLFEGLRYLEVALQKSGESNDLVSSLFANFWLAIVRSVNCEYDVAGKHIDKALEINMRAESLWGTSIIKSNLSYFIYYFQGRINKSYNASYEALRAAIECGDIFSKAMALVCHGISCFGKGLFEKATMYLTEGCNYCEKISLIIFNAIAHFYLGEVQFQIGTLEFAKKHYEEAVRLLDRYNLLSSWKNIFKAALMKVNTYNEGIEYGSIMLKGLQNKNKTKLWEGWIHSCIGEMLLGTGNKFIPEAEKQINRAIEIDNRNGVLINNGRNYILYSKLNMLKGRKDKAKENMNFAIDIFNKCGANGWVKKFEEKINTLK